VNKKAPSQPPPFGGGELPPQRGRVGEGLKLV